MTIADTLQQARRALIDLSTRNRLLSLPAQGRARGLIRIADEDAGFVLEQLAAGRPFGFEAAQASERTGRGARRRAEGVTAARAEATREEWQADQSLRVALTPEELARRLRDLMADARSAREESGVASLYLAVGALIWRDPATPETERTAPLALVPVTLEREGVTSRFRMRGHPEEMVENLSLREKLTADFRISLPDFAAEGWAEKVEAALAGREGWRVDRDALAVGLFAFAKFLMWRDLDPVAHPGLLEHAPLRRLLDPAAPPAEPPPFADDADVDAAIPVERLDHVVEVDGSQALAAEAVRRGHSLVIQGPPGTGKSQTIVNILAQAVLDGRSVLFVAEKSAALEVVKRRLEALGLGAAVLELHGEKPSKRAVLDELRATLALPPPAAPQREAAVQRLGDLRGRLNRHAAAMRDMVGETGVAVQEVIARLAALRASGAAPPPFRLDASGWDAARLRGLHSGARELAANSAGARSPWRGVSASLDAIAASRFQAELPGRIRVLAAAAGGIAEAERAVAAEALRAEAPMQPAEAAAARERLADLRHVAAARVEPRFLPGALQVPGLAAARGTLAQPAGIFSVFDGARRQARATLAAALRDPEDAGALEALLAAQAALARIGTDWPDEETLAGRLAWMERHGDAFTVPPPTEAQRAGLAAWAAIRDATGIEAQESFAALAERLAAMAAEPEALAPWQAWSRAVAAEPALVPLAEALESGAVAPGEAEAALDFAALEALFRVAMREHPELAAFDGAAADRLVADFREADAARVRLARSEAAAKHAERLAALRQGEEAASMAFLRGEFERRRGHAPIRTLMTRAAPLIRKAKPIFMLSPLTVAQFLASPHHATMPGFPVFDLLVMDEASQIEPVDAFGAIARARQVVVVGDDRQMPPSRFFQRLTDGDDDITDEDSALEARDVESILGLANARGIPGAMLRWHYRSRHESLIATSNAEFYGNRLLVLPSPRPRGAALGLSLVRVEGRFAGSANVPEAQAVAEAVLRHAKETPGDTLGVAAFSVTQRDAILDAVEVLRRDSPETEPFFTAHPAEPFFVKNLENVQGDERDAILISVGYGRDASNRLAMRFGPLSMEGGERRLNVLITRAKKRCVVFSGIGAEEIDLARAGGRGVAALKTFLSFAAGGAARDLEAGPASPIGALIGKLVTESGRQAVPHLGLSGLFLDVAARAADGFDLGIELDGADWSALRCARDRDRGRQAALEGMGWKLARSWSLDWLNQPESAQARLRGPLGLAAPDAPRVSADPGLAAPYRETAMEKPPTNRAELGQLVAAIIATESPIHGDAVMERLRLLLGPAAPDARTCAAVLNEARLLHGAREEDGFWFPEEAPPIVPRDRHAAAGFTRRPALIYPDEMAAAARRLLEVQPEASEEELAAGVTRLLGLDSVATPALAARLALLIGSGQIILPAR